jgi:hypothetical protein
MEWDVGKGNGWSEIWRGNGGCRLGESTADELDWDCVQFLGRLDGLGFNPPAVGEGDILTNIQTGCRIHLLSYSMFTRFFSWGMKSSGCEANHLHPISTKYKNEWSCTSLLTPYVFMVWTGSASQLLCEFWY